jgi:hypothetical protein
MEHLKQTFRKKINTATIKEAMPVKSKPRKQKVKTAL